MSVIIIFFKKCICKHERSRYCYVYCYTVIMEETGSIIDIRLVHESHPSEH